MGREWRGSTGSGDKEGAATGAASWPGRRTLVVQRSATRASRAADGDAKGAVETAVASSGEALPKDAQARLEPSLGADLSGVRVHTGTAAHDASQAVSARAFTVGQDIFFASGQYAPASRDGFHLLAHEAAHAVENAAGRGPPATGGGLEISQPHQASERAADHAADRALAGEAAAVRSPGTAAASSGLAVQRQACDDEEENPFVDEKTNARQEYEALTGLGLDIQGGLKKYKSKLRKLLIKHFNTFADAYAYYCMVGETTFLGYTVMVHGDLADRLTAAEAKLQEDQASYKAIVDGMSFGYDTTKFSPVPGKKLMIRLNENDASQLSDHSYGRAIDLRPKLNPNVPSKKAFNPGLINAVTGVAIGSAIDTMRGGGTVADMEDPATDITAASAAYKAAFKDEASVQQAMSDYLARLSMNTDGFTIDEVKKAAKSGNQKKLIGDLRARVGDFVLTRQAQLEEDHQAFLAQGGDETTWADIEEEKQDEIAEKWKAIEDLDAQAAKVEGSASGDKQGKSLRAKANKLRTKSAQAAAKRAAKMLVDIWKAYKASLATRKETDADPKDGRDDPTRDGTAGSLAANGFTDLPAKLIASMTGSDGGGLVWRGATKEHDFMHFELP